MTADEVVKSVERDRVFYEESGGGITLSGGEPMAQATFARVILARCRQTGLHTCMETCGVAPREMWPEIVPWVRLFLWDIKHTNETEHRRLTGVSLPFVLENLRQVDAAGVATRLRCILLAGVNLNPDHLDGIARLFHSLEHCEGVDLLPSHPMGGAKSASLGLAEPYRPEWIPEARAVSAAADDLRTHRSVPVTVL